MPLVGTPRKWKGLLFTGCIISLILFHRLLFDNTGTPRSFSQTPCANATLGFGVVLAISSLHSPRRASLVQAANVTEIDITIPTQPLWTEDDVQKFKSSPDSLIKDGSILAWLGHLNALQWFLDSGHETALILEDDVDWDIRLRSIQIPLAAKAIRSILPPSYPAYYWGNPLDWDLLYIGHCGDYFKPLSTGVGVGHIHPENLAKIPHVLFHDGSLPTRHDLHPFTASFLTALNVPEKTRVVHQSRSPLCSFGYAVTRTAARRLMTEIALPREREPDPATAYDVVLLRACNAEGFRCWSVNPELFHHKEGQSIIAATENNPFKPPVDEAGYEQVKYRNETANIWCGFWSGDFEFGEDVEKLEHLRTEVGRKGRCLKPGRVEV